MKRRIEPGIALGMGGARVRGRVWVAGLAVVLTGACGCTVLSYTSSTGERFSRTSLGAQTSVASLSVECDTNGVRRVEMRGYQNETTQALGTVTEAAVRAALQSPVK